MNIADIYIRVSTKGQETGHGLKRQEEACRELCKQRGFKVRNVISDVCSAYDLENLRSGQLGKKFDQWRKSYWEQQGEPLIPDECAESVIPEIPPNHLVIEDMDRFTRSGPMGIMLLKFMTEVGITFNFSNHKKLILGKGNFPSFKLSKEDDEIVLSPA